MSSKRIKRLNSLLKEVISEVILKEVRNPDVSSLVTVTDVDISADLHYATVSISVIGDEKDKEKTLKALQSAAGFIGVQASKQVVMRYFPQLTFEIDNSVDDHMKIDKILKNIKQEEESRNGKSSD
ncbi:MAG: 30S ribosome-binding factor RbfA [Chlamydiota bacterium]|jgi:ribosome-binding factor A